MATTDRPGAATLPPDGAPLRVVLDTNVAMSFWHSGHPRMLRLLAWMEGRGAALLTRAQCLDELAHTLACADFARAPARRGALLVDHRARTVAFAEPDLAELAAALALPRCRDRDDQKFLALAWAADAHLLLIRDQRVLAVAGRAPWAGRTAIVTPERLAKRLGAD